MKIGIISDVHANVENLRRALALLRDLGADEIVCAGDLVDGETEGEAAAQLIIKQQIPCVQGNHDHALSGATAAHYAEWREQWDEAELGFHPWQYSDDGLTDETLDYLRDLPLARRFEWAERRVLLRHASTWDQVTYCYANGRPDPFYRIAAEAQAQAADYVILGHTHMPMAVEVGGVWVFNPGSVDSNRFEPYASTCALLELSPLRYRVFDVETRQPTPYLFTRINPNQHTNDGHTHIDLG